MIDDSAAYCSNCGTKLLFPEDEFIEEDIPGEKIVEEEVIEKKDPPKRKPGRPRKKKEEPVIIEDEKVDKDIEAEKKTEKKSTAKEISINDPPPDDSPEETSKDFEEADITDKEDIPLDEPILDEEYIKDTEDEVDLLDEPSPESVDDLPTIEDKPDDEPEESKSVTGDFLDAIEETKSSKAGGIEDSIYHIDIKGAQEDIPDVNVTSSKPLPETPPEREEIETGSQEFVTLEELDEAAEEEEEPHEEEKDESSETDYHIGDQMSIFDPIEKEKKDIERFLSTLRKERQVDVPDPAQVIADASAEAERAEKAESEPEVEEDPAIKFEPADEVEPGDESKLESRKETGTGLPPWAKEIERDDVEFPTTDQPLQVPAEIPPVQTVEPVEDSEPPPSWMVDKEEDKESSAAKRYRPREKRIRIKNKVSESGGTQWLKSRIFDLIFVGVFWFFALWLASRIIGNSVFTLISTSTELSLALLGLILLEYFFLFYFFLGGTLGDRMFPRKG